MTALTEHIEHIFSPDGPLAKTLPGYEVRPGQLQMSLSVAQTLETTAIPLHPFAQGDHKAEMLAVEAETGIGKTLAYLIPAALSRQKIIVSTGTLNLQEQILNKEIPFIKKYVTPDLKVVCVKGRQNYACLFRTKQMLSSQQQQLFTEQINDADELLHWLNHTEFGDRAELPWLTDGSQLWEQICSSATKCLGSQCQEHGSCFINKLRKTAAAADIIIVNHHLFFSDLGIRRFGFGEVLPRYQSVIFDEAHHIEDIATRYFGSSFSHYQLLDLVKDIETLAHKSMSGQERLKTIQIAQALATQANEFAGIFPTLRGRYPLNDIISQVESWEVEVERLDTAITNLSKQLDRAALCSDLWEGPRRRCLELKDNLTAITTDLSPTHVYWCEKREKTISLTASPINVSVELQEFLYSQAESLIFTSATLTSGGSFKYTFNRLGLDDNTPTLQLASPFDYANRTKLYVPANGFPEPNSPTYFEALQQQVYELLMASQGRALVLFTSFNAMNQLYSFLSETIPFPIYKQGDAPKTVLLEQFQQETHSVLLAVASFWEGVNVPGETLSCLIIDKLPFEVPSDPVIMARIDQIKNSKGNPFFDFQVPRAVLSLRQGIGRLIRSTQDKGLLAVLDIRLFSKGYGRHFLKSLPASPVIRSIDQVKTFFSEVVGE
nr:ATP-dependent DNA helicase [Desulfobulbaceae bacterium]